MLFISSQALQGEITALKRDAMLAATKRSPRASLTVGTAVPPPPAVGATAGLPFGVMPSPRSAAGTAGNFPSVASPRFSGMSSGDRNGGIAMLMKSKGGSGYPFSSAFYPSPSAAATAAPSSSGMGKPPSQFQFSSADVARSSTNNALSSAGPSVFGLGVRGTRCLIVFYM